MAKAVDSKLNNSATKDKAKADLKDKKPLKGTSAKKSESREGKPEKHDR